MDDIPAGFAPIETSDIPSGFVPMAEETSPLDLPTGEAPLIMIPNGAVISGASRSGFGPQFIPSIVVKAAKSGVEYDRPAKGGHFLSSFAFDEKNRLEAYRMATGTSVRIGPQTGEIEYLNPQTGRYALALPPGAVMESIEGLAGPAVTLGAETFLATGTALFTKSPALTTFAAASGTFIGEIARLNLGKQMGINKDVTDDQIITAAAKSAGITAAFGVAGQQLMRVGKFVGDVINGRAFNQATLKEMDLSVEEAQKIADDINSRVKTEKLKFDVAQATGDDDLLHMRDTFKRSKNFSKQFGAFDDQQFKSLEEFYSTINRPFNSRLSTPQTGDAVQDVAKSEIQRDLDRQNILVRMKEAELDSASRSIATRPHENLGPILRDVGETQQAEFTLWAREAATSLHNAAGGAPFIANRATHEAVSRIDDQVRSALFPSVQKPQRGLIGEEMDGDTIRKVFDPNARFTFIEAWEAISALKRIERVASKGLSTDAPEVGAVRSLYQALESDLRHSAQNSPLADQYDAFIRKYAQEKRRLDEGLVGQIMEKRGGKNGRYVIADDQVFMRFFTPGSDRAAKEILELVKNNPEQMQGVREAIGDFYKRTVMTDGRVDMAKHKAFMERYSRAAQVFFNKAEMRIFAKPGQVEQALRARETARRDAVDRINQTFEADIANLNNPGKVLSLVMDPSNPDKARQMMTMLDRTPDVKRAVRHQFVKQMTDRIHTMRRPGEPSLSFSPANLDRFLNGRGGDAGHRGIVKEVMGETYLKDMDTLNQALKIVSREARFPNRSNTAFWTDTVKNISRAYVGLFTRPGRMVTAIDRLRGRAAERVLANAMLNPENMRELMALAGRDLRSEKAAAIVSALGGSALLQDYD